MAQSLAYLYSERSRLFQEIANLRQQLAYALQNSNSPNIAAGIQARLVSAQELLAEVDAQIQTGERDQTAGTASSGNLVRDDQLATAPSSLPQSPDSPPQVLQPDGRIATAPDTSSGTSAIQPVDSAAGTPNVDQGLDAPTKTLSQTQATSGAGGGQSSAAYATNDPRRLDINREGSGVIPGPDLASAPANTQAGVGAPGEDSGQARTPNATQQEINTIFSNSPITPLPNVLDKYASYTYGVSLYLTTKEAYTTMVSTGQKNLSGCWLLMQSAGIPTGSRVPYFNNDYYIDTVKLQSKIIGKGTGSNHNVVDIDFTISEPTGITLIPNLTKAIQQFYPDVAAKKSFSSVVYLMVIRFYGYDQNGNLVRGAPGNLNSANRNTDANAFVEKFFPLQIKDIKFKVGTKLVEYDVKAVGLHYNINVGSKRGSIPYNIELSGQSVNDLLNGTLDASNVTGGGRSSTTFAATDPRRLDLPPAGAPANAGAIPLANGATVRQGLITALNNYQRELSGPGADCPYTYPDVYSVEFATPALKNAKVKKAGGLERSKTSNAVGQTAADQKLGSKQSVDTNSRTQGATAGMQIVQLLDQIVRNSSYLEDQQLVTYDEASGQLLRNGTAAKNVAWFKINLQATPQFDKYDPKRNDFAYNIKYIISPYRIAQLNSEYFPKPTFTGVQKEYNYWFTGKNTSVLNYEETLNNLYYITLSGVNFNKAAFVDTSGVAADDQVQKSHQTRSTESSQGADGKTNEPIANAAEQLLNPADFKESSMTIVGDPAWLQQGEAFVGRPVGSSDYFSAFLADGTINFDAGQVLYRIAFNSADDYNLNTGLQTITGQAQSSSGSGTDATALTGRAGGPAAINRTFVAKEVYSTFSKGKFTQELKGSILLDKTTADNAAAAAATQFLQQQAINALSSSRLTSSLTAAVGGFAMPAWMPASINGAASTVTNSAVNYLAQNVLGGQSTRPSALPGAPTSGNQVIDILNRTFSAPSKLNNVANQGDQITVVQDPYYGLTPEQIEALGLADPTDPFIRARLGIPQISEIERPPVVNPLSNQTMAGTDDSGDSSTTAEFLFAGNNETPRLLDAPQSTPSDLNDFFG
jgi:hypothetical protein